MKVRESAFKRPKEPRSTANEILRSFAAALLAADQMGLDTVAIVREQLQDEGILPKPKNDHP